MAHPNLKLFDSFPHLQNGSYSLALSGIPFQGKAPSPHLTASLQHTILPVAPGQAKLLYTSEHSPWPVLPLHIMPFLLGPPDHCQVSDLSFLFCEIEIVILISETVL